MMVEINCGECARGILENGCIPDKCLPEYRLFIDPHDDPKKFCRRCGRRLKRAWKEKFNPEYSKVTLKCPKCGIVVYIDEQFLEKKLENLSIRK